MPWQLELGRSVGEVLAVSAAFLLLEETVLTETT